MGDGRYLPRLDGLRAAAIGLVLLEHTTGASRMAGLHLGQAGVWLFFALSGYLITGILLRAREGAAAAGASRGGAWRAFWARRALRIFPLYFAAIAVACALDLRGARRDWAWCAAFAANLSPDPRASALGHFWSLAVEEQFYLLWPAACLFLPRERLAALALAGAVAAPALRLAALRLGAPAGVWALPCCLDGLGIGAYLAASGRPPSARWAWAGAVVLAVVVAARAAGVGWAVAEAVEPAGVALVAWRWVARAADERRVGTRGRGLAWPPLVALGKISYGFYVLHFPLLFALDIPRGAGRLLAVGLGTTALAAPSWKFFESPILRLKRHFPYAPGAPAPGGETARPRPVRELTGSPAGTTSRACPRRRRSP